MQTFDYKGLNENGQISRGLIEAMDLKDAREKLFKQAVLVQKIKVVGVDGSGKWFRKRSRFNTETRAIFYRETAFLLKAGIPLSQAFQVLIDSPELGETRALIAGTRDSIKAGESLADALDRSSDTLSDFEKAAIEVGEHAGTLGDMLERLAVFIEEQQSLKERVSTALVYPVIVLTFAIVIAIVILGVLLPLFGGVLSEIDIPLPLITRSMLFFGEAATYVGLPLLIGIGVFLFWGRKKLKLSKRRQIQFNQWIFKIPLWGKAYTALVNLRFSRTLSFLLKGGLPLVETLSLAGRSTGNVWISHLVDQETQTVKQGETLANAISRIPPLRGSLPGWIRAGEVSGEIPQLLESAGKRYEQQWERLVTRSIAVFEPLLVLLAGGFVLLLALAILLPILSLNKTVL